MLRSHEADFVCDNSLSPQARAGAPLCMEPDVGQDGKKLVVMAEMMVGMLLEMVTGSELTPKGGLKELLVAREAGLALPKPTGSNGNGSRRDGTDP